MHRAFVLTARVAMVLAFAVVVLGAWVRATDAGLGCPDWPGCYGRLVVSEQIASDPQLQGQLADRPLDTGKAWREMIHRYLASTLGLLCVALALISWLNRRDPGQPRRVPLVLLGLVVLQGLLGMWTVTLLLKPIIVVAHLLGGISTLALLFWLSDWRASAPRVSAATALKASALTGAAVLVTQISLGGWTSANYAALACPDFPTCQTQWWPQIADFKEGFVLWRDIGVNYEGGVLDHPARVAVHFVHRLGALLTAILLAVLGVLLVRRPAARWDGFAVLLALAAQLALGIGLVLSGVPLALAVAHNGVAAFLLLTVINANQRIWHR
jgi:cytochrome c oxidase assembly protein subunit 15